jgi:hypothetical protein
MGIVEIRGWTRLLEDAVRSLGRLDNGELESLAESAKKMLDARSTSLNVLSKSDSATLLTQREVLGELLHFTAGQIGILRRMRSGAM